MEDVGGQTEATVGRAHEHWQGEGGDRPWTSRRRTRREGGGNEPGLLAVPALSRDPIAHRETTLGSRGRHD